MPTRCLVNCSMRRTQHGSQGRAAGFRLRAATNESGKDMQHPSTVATKAIFRVSTIPIHAVEQVKANPGAVRHGGQACGSVTLQSGGHKDSLTNTIRFENPSPNRPQSSTMPLATEKAEMSKVAKMAGHRKRNHARLSADVVPILVKGSPR